MKSKASARLEGLLREYDSLLAEYDRVIDLPNWHLGPQESLSGRIALLCDRMRNECGLSREAQEDAVKKLQKVYYDRRLDRGEFPSS